ncbi:Torsin-3A [Dissostichus eleginoides]|uniref:Torsin-3A n=1 Tax=Dissostichus eleginoides TaxID=100907 RepID=A0AAD9BT99_DISEL|nr:Torsin-3A [Dissostichus eleginoides]
MMAAAAVAAERGGGTGGTGAPGGPSPAGASARAEGSSPRPGSAGFSVLVVVGSLRANGLLERLLKQIETSDSIGGATINDVALDFWHSGQNREDIGMEDLEHRLRAETMESHGGFAQSELMSGHLIDFFVPFLPLEYRHVKLCARDAYTARGLQTDVATLDEVAKAMLYVPKEERLFSAQGCKSIPQRINFFLP